MVARAAVAKDEAAALQFWRVSFVESTELVMLSAIARCDCCWEKHYEVILILIGSKVSLTCLCSKFEMEVGICCKHKLWQELLGTLLCRRPFRLVTSKREADYYPSPYIH